MHHGMLTVYKEAGYTSSDAVARLRGILRMRKIGHTGTLDPDAEGVLPMCLGNATRICELIADREKEYVAVMRLGVRTDTQDMSGEILSQIPENRILGMILQKYDTAEPLSDTMDSGIAPREVTDSEEIFSVGSVSEAADPEDTATGVRVPDGRTLPEEVPFEKTERDCFSEKVTVPDAIERDCGSEEVTVPDAIERDCGSEQVTVLDAIVVTAEEQEIICKKIAAAATAFTGEIEQIPPMYSAIKVNGKRLYDMARKGITVERKPRRITIYSLKIEKVELPLVTMRVRCSKGTYIRTLCEDLGDALGTGAAMQSLLRTRVGQFTLDEARTLDELERIAKTEPDSMPPLIRPVDSFFADLPAAECDGEALRLLKNGNPLMPKEFRFLSPEEDPQRRWSSENLIAKTEEKPVIPAEKNEDFGCHESALPGIEAGEKVIRMYDAEGSFYGLYRTKKNQGAQGRFYAYKMFLPEK